MENVAVRCCVVVMSHRRLTQTRSGDYGQMDPCHGILNIDQAYAFECPSQQRASSIYYDFCKVMTVPEEKSAGQARILQK